MPTTSSHAIPYPAGGDGATVPADMQALAEQVDSELDDISPGQISGVAAGRILVANGSGVVTGVAMSGDATISPAGALEIGEGKIGTTELADLAATTAKLDNGAVTSAKIAAQAVLSGNLKLAFHKAHGTVKTASGVQASKASVTPGTYFALGQVQTNGQAHSFAISTTGGAATVTSDPTFTNTERITGQAGDKYAAGLVTAQIVVTSTTTVQLSATWVSGSILADLTIFGFTAA